MRIPKCVDSLLLTLSIPKSARWDHHNDELRVQCRGLSEGHRTGQKDQKRLRRRTQGV